MSTPTTILQPTAHELMQFVQMAAQNKNLAIKFTVEINHLTDEMTAQEVCTVLNASMRTVTALIEKGILHPVKRLNKNVFSRAELHKAIDAGKL